MHAPGSPAGNGTAPLHAPPSYLPRNILAARPHYGSPGHMRGTGARPAHQPAWHCSTDRRACRQQGCWQSVPLLPRPGISRAAPDAVVEHIKALGGVLHVAACKVRCGAHTCTGTGDDASMVVQRGVTTPTISNLNRRCALLIM
jgi:hypothetical protein